MEEQIYVKLVNKQIQQAPQNKDDVINYNLNIDLMLADGYKPLIKAVIPQTTRMYHFEYKEHKNDITEIIVYDETQEEADARILESAKEAKTKENETLRDEALLSGVTYKNVLFDSDTDQKINLLATIETLPEQETIIWYGMNNQSLECDKEDLMNIGALITELNAFCWSKNSIIETEINNATTVEEVNDIEINYESEE